MALETLLGGDGGVGLISLAGLVASFPMARHRGRLQETKKEFRSPKEKEFGPPDFDDFMAVWEGLCQVRRSEHYGLSARTKGVVTNRDVAMRIASLCRRADFRANLERKLVALALKRDARDAESFYPGRGLPIGGKTKLTFVECKKVLKYMQGVGLLVDLQDARLVGHPIFEYAHRPEVFARAFAMQAGRPNDSIAHVDKPIIYEFFSLDVGQVLSEQGRYYLMKGCAEVTPDPKMGIVKIKLFQRWGPSPKQRTLSDARPIHAMDEEYDGHVFLQDDIVYGLAFKSERSHHGHAVGHDGHARRNMVSLVLSGLSRDSDGFHRKLTGGQLGQGIGGTVGVLAAPCVFYQVSDARIDEIKNELQEVDKPLWTKLTGPNFKGSLKFEILKWDSGFIDLLNGVDQRYAPVMADLDVPMPLPVNDEEGGPEVFVVGKGQH